MKSMNRQSSHKSSKKISRKFSNGLLLGLKKYRRELCLKSIFLPLEDIKRDEDTFLWGVEICLRSDVFS